jgi:hypothetical protein
LLDYTDVNNPVIVEIKSTQNKTWLAQLQLIGELPGIPAERRFIVYRGTNDLATEQFQVRNTESWLAE